MFESVDGQTDGRTPARVPSYKLTLWAFGSGELIKQASAVIGKQVLAFSKSEKSEFINIGIFAASSGGRKGRRHIRRLTPDPERSHVCIRPVWSESSLSAWRKLGSLATHWAHSEDSDQTGCMPRLIWVFAGRTVILSVLSWGGSNILWYRTDTYPVRHQITSFSKDLLKKKKNWAIRNSHVTKYNYWILNHTYAAHHSIVYFAFMTYLGARVDVYLGI